VPSLKGRLLVALPVLVDPNFDRTIVLVLEHGDEGALGVVLNRPGDLRLDDPLPSWADVAAPPAVVFVGGPVGAGAAIGLGLVPGAPPERDGFIQVAGDLGTVDLGSAPLDVGVAEVRVFAGYAGWGPDQLEDELLAGAWLVTDALPGDALSHDPSTLWRRVLRRQPGRLAWLANLPMDPSVN
jgi:putative transcriptional regulator